MKTIIFRSKLLTILTAGIIAGTLDILTAIFLFAKGHASGVFMYIASAAFGKAAFQGGTEMVILGIIFHFTIALSFATGYFFFFPYIPLLKKQKILSGLLYGIYVWGFMRYLVLPLTFCPPAPLTIDAWKGILILMLAVGLPISLITGAYYSNK